MSEDKKLQNVGEMLDDVFERDPSLPRNFSDVALNEMRERSRAWKSGGDYVVFGLEPGCGPEAVRNRYYEMVKIHHPDVYASRRNKEFKRVAERLFMQIQRSYSNLRRAETVPTITDNSLPRPKCKSKPVPRPVLPEMHRLTGIRNKPVEIPVAINLDQLVIQARRAAHDSQYDNVAKMIRQAIEVGYTNFDTSALDPLSAYMTGDLGGAEARKAIEGAREMSSTPIEESRLETYLGHVARMESDPQMADGHYRRAIRLDPDNLEAIRWTRHLHRQKAQGAQKKSKRWFGGLFRKK